MSAHQIKEEIKGSAEECPLSEKDIQTLRSVIDGIDGIEDAVQFETLIRLCCAFRDFIDFGSTWDILFLINSVYGSILWKWNPESLDDAINELLDFQRRFFNEGKADALSPAEIFELIKLEYGEGV